MTVSELGFKKTAASITAMKRILREDRAIGMVIRRGKKTSSKGNVITIAKNSKSPRNELIQTSHSGNKGSLARRRMGNKGALENLEAKETPANLAKSVASYKGFAKSNYPKKQAVKKRVVGNEFLDASKRLAQNTAGAAAGAAVAGGAKAAKSSAITSLKFDSAIQGARAAYRSIRKPDKQQLRRVLTQKPELRKKPWEI